MKIFSKNTWGVDVNNAWPLTCKASCLKKIELRPLISGFDFALLEVRNLCVASRLVKRIRFFIKGHQTVYKGPLSQSYVIFACNWNCIFVKFKTILMFATSALQTEIVYDNKSKK